MWPTANPFKETQDDDVYAIADAQSWRPHWWLPKMMLSRYQAGIGMRARMVNDGMEVQECNSLTKGKPLRQAEDMALKITSDCINYDICEPECPNKTSLATIKYRKRPYGHQSRLVYRMHRVLE